MTFRSASKRLFSACLLVAACSGIARPAMALDADDFASRLAAMSGQAGARLSYSAAEADGSSIVLKSVRADSPDQPPVDLGDVTFKGVEEEDDGSYIVKETVLPAIAFSDGADTVFIDGIEITGLTIPVSGGDSPLDVMLLYEGMSTGQVRGERDGAAVFSMSALDLDIKRSDDGSNVGMKMTGSDLEIGLSAVKKPKAREFMRQLGHEKISGELKAEATWDKPSGIINVEHYDLTLDKIGQLAVSLELSGYAPEQLGAVKPDEGEAADAADPDPQSSPEALAFPMSGIVRQLSLNSASLRFDDASFTERALEMAGRKQGISGDQMRLFARFMLPLALWQLGIPALQQQISAAASVYLENPQNITITATPAEPVAVPVIMGLSSSDPRALASLLNVQVKANKPVEICCKQ